jgi:hypothetical protein
MAHAARECDNPEVSGRFSDPNWWPAPRPQEAPSGSKVLAGLMLPLLAIGVVVAAAFGLKHTGHKAATPACPPAQAAAACVERTQAPATRSVPTTDAREAFAECMQGAGGRGGGRFSGPSQSYRLRFELCRSLMQSSAQRPAKPPPATTTPAAPVA